MQKQLGAEIHFLTKKNFTSVLEFNPYISKLWTFDKEPDRLFPKLKEEEFDEIIDLHNNLRSAKVVRALKVPVFKFKKFNLEKYLLVNLKWDRLPDVHIVDRYLNAVNHHSLENDSEGLDFFTGDANLPLETVNWLTANPNFVALSLSGTYTTKQMPTALVEELIEGLNAPIFLLGGPNERLLADQLNYEQVFHAIGELNLVQTGEIIKQASIMITGDTGTMHMGAALHCPMAVIWGNTVPKFGMGPYYGNKRTRYKNFEVEQLGCRPCSKLGHRSCPKKHFKCMLDQNSSEIVDFCHSVIS